ncbi:MAG TPA: carbohydrate ABC transporter permease [Candidatus Eisenbergiella merdipullorum]|uniref:Carbohydrate ABC transporter permease n=1 Tax=Candidatus Eisenbergiella merdipullorum TaxID=2838553 RepID=A0A9D2I7R1_9FIRM|nr:carbohydrate ABC transporter permease [Candidatus Eisenbergiella merdipullorum]
MNAKLSNRSVPRRIFNVFNIILMLLLALLCIAPFIHVIAVSFSNKAMVSAGYVSFWPRGLTASAYQFLLTRTAFWNALKVSFLRTVLGTCVNLFLILLTAYPLSKDGSKLTGRTAYTWYFFITMLVSGGMIPNYLLVTRLGLRDSIWSLILPGALPIFNLVLMLNFFRTVPEELEDAALIDGASHLRTLLQIYVPVSKPAIATIALFCMVNHWNAWFDGMIYINTPSKVPLQTYLRNVILNMDMSEMTGDDWMLLQTLSDQSLRCAQIIIAVLPILCVYPFLQRYFVSGIVLGSVKG